MSDRLATRKDSIGTYGKIKPGTKIRLPRQEDDGSPVEFITGIIRTWEQPSDICRDYTWDVEYSFESDPENYVDVISVIIDPPLNMDNTILFVDFDTLADSPVEHKLQFVLVSDEFFMSIDRAFDFNPNASTEWEMPISYI